MAQLRQTYQQFQEANTAILVIGPEEAAAFRVYWEKHGLPFLGLPDPRRSVLSLYGQEVHLLRLGRMPAQVLVDAAGMVRFLHYGSTMRDIPAAAEVLALLRGMRSGSGEAAAASRRA